MSGGSWNYLTHNVYDAAERLEAEKDPLRRSFGAHLYLVAKALYEIEWYDSGDRGGEAVEPAIHAVLGDSADHAVAGVLIEDAKALIHDLQRAVVALELLTDEGCDE